MKITILERYGGKTTQLIKRCYEENQKPNNLTYIVCPTRERCFNISKRAKQLKIEIPFPMAMFELFEHSGRGFIKNILIDDIDEWLKMKSPFNILEVTATKEQENER